MPSVATVGWLLCEKVNRLVGQLMSLEGDGDHLGRKPAGDRPAKARTACHEECAMVGRFGGLRRKRLGGSNCLPAGKDPGQSPDALSLRPTCPPQKVARRVETMLVQLEQSPSRMAFAGLPRTEPRSPRMRRSSPRHASRGCTVHSRRPCTPKGGQNKSAFAPEVENNADRVHATAQMGTFWTLRQLRSLAATQGMARTARLRRVSSSERPTLMARHASSITTTANPSRFASSAV